MNYVEDLRQDTRYALRQIRRAPAAAALIVATLAIGIGANVTMAGAIDRLLLRPPPHVHEPERLVRPLVAGTDTFGDERVSEYSNYTMFLDLEREVSAFDGIAAFSQTRLSFGIGRDAEQVPAALVSPSFFRVLGPRPVLGRFFSADDGFPPGEAGGGPALAVISHSFWLRAFAAAPDVVGRPIRLGQLTYTIVGVAPEGFRGVVDDHTDVWLPAPVAAPMEVPTGWYGGRGSTWVRFVAQLRPGVAREVAERQVAAVYLRYEGGPFGFNERKRVVAASVIRGRGPDAPREVKVALWLSGVSALVLLIACANIANLLLTRALTRRREIAVRVALGAGRGRLTRQMLTEALLLASFGGVAAIYLALLGDRLLGTLFVFDTADSALSGRFFLFAAGVTLATGLIISLAPLLQSTSGFLSELTRGGATIGRRGARVRGVLVATQAALCTLLLIAAALFASSLGRVHTLDLGVDLDHTMFAYFNIVPEARPRDEIDQLYETMLARVRAIPGVRGAALEAHGFAIAPYTEGTRDRRWWDMTKKAGYLTGVDHGYFRTLGTKSLRGRDFDERDVAGAEQVAIITAPLATLLWPGGDPLGKCLMIPEMRSSDRRDECVTVVGVMGGFWRLDILDRDELLVYIPRVQRPRAFSRPRVMYIAASGDAKSVAAVAITVRQTIQSVRPGLPAMSVTLERDRVEPQMRPWRLAATMFSLFGIVALVIAAVGVYGVVSFAATQRAREVAIRLVLGARPADILALVAGKGLGALLAGLAVGAGAALVIGRWLGALLYETSPRDPRIIVGVATFLLVTGVLASAIPVARLLRRSTAASLRLD